MNATSIQLNINRTPAIQTILSANLNTTNTFLHTASTNLHALTWSWDWIKDLFKTLCGRCGQYCGGSCSTGGGDTGGGDTGGGDTGDSIPLDGGLGILALGATIFGIKKLRKNNKV